MSKRYTGGVVSSSLPTVNAAGASGVFLLSQQADAQSRNAWPPYKIEKSLRFRSAASGYLNRTPAVASNQKTFTISFWAKIGNLGTYRSFFSAGTANPPFVDISLQNTDEFQVDMSVTAGRVSPKTTALFRDPSAWYHFVVAFDTTQATQANRAKVYVNGVEQTLSALGVAQNTDLAVNSAVAHNLGRRAVASDSYHEGYMSEVYFVDGQALTPSSFGATDKDGNWSPIAYTGTYGTNGFYVNFRDNTSATTMGYDYSGNGNNWTLNGFNVSTANTTYDIMIDVPEDQSDGTANNRGNYATFNPLEKGSNVTLSEGNLKYSTSSVSGVNGIVSMRISTGMKSYFEFTCGSVALYRNISIGGMTYTGDSGSISGGTGGTGTFATWTTGDIIRFACDYNAGTIACYKNATLQTTVTGITNTSDWVINAAQSTNTTGEYTANFGQRPFAYEPPSGFKTLNTFNLPEPTIKQPNKYFDVNLWTGNGTSQNIVNNGSMQPDLVWVKQRNGTYRHQLVDAVRGATRSLFSSDSDAEATYQGVTAFNSNGFSVGTELGTNENGSTFVGWQWNAGNANTTNTSGTITSIVRANPTAGFSVATYTGTGSNATVGHGLSVAPQMILVKNRAASGYNWLVYHKFMATSSPATWYMSLNSTAAASNGANVWIDDPTSTVFTISGSYPEVNGSANTYVAYCFAPIAGYSAFGSYTGNGSTDGTFVYTGFRPAFILIKNSSATGYWVIFDVARNTYNAMTSQLWPNAVDAENNSYGVIDVVSNGFKLRNTAAGYNDGGATYIYAAFAEMPFKYARSR